MFEETRVDASIKHISAVRLLPNDVWIIFLMDYVSGTPRTDKRENDLACFMDINDATLDSRVTGSTQFLLRNHLQNPNGGLQLTSFVPEDFTRQKYTMFTAR